MRPIAIAPALALLAAVASCDGARPAGSLVKADLSRPGLTQIATADDAKMVAGQTIYVPAYSHVYIADNAQPLNLATTLYFRNTDPDLPLILTRVRYFDSGGKFVRGFLKSAVRLDPLASAEFFVQESDVSGGASPSFLVEWVSEQRVSDPVAETVMISTTGTQGISFACPGRVIRSRQP